MKKPIIAFLLGLCAFLVATAAVWFYLATRTALEGHSQPDFVPDRGAALILSMALGSAVGSAGTTYVNLKDIKAGWTTLFLMIILPFLVSFILLFIAHSQLPSLQFSDNGEPQSPWGYLIICPLPVIVGLFAGSMLSGSSKGPNKNEDTKPI